MNFNISKYRLLQNLLKTWGNDYILSKVSIVQPSRDQTFIRFNAVLHAPVQKVISEGVQL